MYWLISGYNTMSAEKKKNVDTQQLGILMGNVCFILGFLTFFGFLLIVLQAFTAGMIVLALFFPVIIYTLITAQKYDGNTRTADNKMKTSAKIIVGIIVAALIGVLGFVATRISKDMQPMTAHIEQNSLVIDGSYGQTILISDLQEIQLIDTLPVIERRTNGSATGDMLRGYFQLSQVGTALLYLDRENPPFILLTTKVDKIYLNLETAEQTRELFDALHAAQ